MNYQTHYNLLVAKAKIRPHESGNDWHHIMPKSLGGTNDYENLISLTPREHYFAHLLLIKITKGKDKSKMVFAMFRFSPKGSPKFGNGRKYELARKLMSEALKGENNPFFGRHLSEEHRKKISGENHGMWGTHCYQIWEEKFGKDECERLKLIAREKRSKSLSGEGNPMYGKKHSAERNKSHAECLTGRKAMYKDGKQKRVKPESFEEFLSLGWSFSKTLKNL